MNRRILKLAVPSILANITVPLVGMVDIAVSGRLGNVAAIGAIAVGSMLFDLLYWNFGFLRVGTGGLTAQAYGRKDMAGAIKYFVQGESTALLSATFLIAIQWLFVETAFLFIDCSGEVQELARKYFFIRIWDAPATLSLMVFKGWFIGMQNTVFPMIVDMTVNIVNLSASIWLGLHTPLGFAGVALGTVIAQYTGLILASVLMAVHYRKLFGYVNIRRDVRFKYMKSFYVLNANLFLRSLCFMLIYCGFTSLAAHYGDVQLAVSTIIMKLLMLYSYILDGFAYAGEALTGRYIGAQDRPSLNKAVRLLFIWTAGPALHMDCRAGRHLNRGLRHRRTVDGQHDDHRDSCNRCIQTLYDMAGNHAGVQLHGLHVGRHLHRSDRRTGHPQRHDMGLCVILRLLLHIQGNNGHPGPLHGLLRPPHRPRHLHDRHRPPPGLLPHSTIMS